MNENPETHGKSSGRYAYLTAIISLASAAFGVIAALAWNAAITELFALIFPPAIGIVGLFIYAIAVTIIAVIVIVNLGRSIERVKGSESVYLPGIRPQDCSSSQ
jgi:hypothetical protein